MSVACVGIQDCCNLLKRCYQLVDLIEVTFWTFFLSDQLESALITLDKEFLKGPSV